MKNFRGMFSFRFEGLISEKKKGEHSLRTFNLSLFLKSSLNDFKVPQIAHTYATCTRCAFLVQTTQVYALLLALIFLDTVLQI